MKKSKYMRGGGKSSEYKAAGGMKTEVGKEAKTQSYKEYVQKMFGGGNTSGPAMKKNKAAGGTYTGMKSKNGSKGGKKGGRR
jgi:hypothetical protein